MKVFIAYKNYDNEFEEVIVHNVKSMSVSNQGDWLDVSVNKNDESGVFIPYAYKVEVY